MFEISERNCPAIFPVKSICGFSTTEIIHYHECVTTRKGLLK
jgi:hypothetical protein